jgi:NAD(P)-dependent dehydrogenase (short-subunit alcohol dehydrogenase family)
MSPLPRYALVTGAARGIGLEVCRQLAARDVIVFLPARTLARAASAAASIDAPPDRVRPLPLDVADPRSVAAAADTLAREPGQLDVLVNNAGAFSSPRETASAADLAAARAVLDVNLFGAWRVTQAVLPLLRRGIAPRVVNVASGAGSHDDGRFGLATSSGAASYGVAKAALLALTTKLAVELKDDGILVNAVCPGLTATRPGEPLRARPVSNGAAGIVWAALLGGDGPTGGFFRDRERVPW